MSSKRRFLGLIIICFIVVALGIIGGFWAFWGRKIAHSRSFSLDKAAKVENLIPMLVIGSGPAGLSAALYGARGKIDTTVVEGQAKGGALMTTSEIENWPGVGKIKAPLLMDNFEKHVVSFGAKIAHDAIVKADFSSWPYTFWTEDEKVIKAMTVVIATGATPKKLGVPGEKEYWGHGVSTCAVCDAPFFKDTRVAVVGGGDSAMEEALQLAHYAKEVIILARADSLRASAIMQDRVKQTSNISIRYNTTVEKVEGDKEFVTKAIIKTKEGEETLPLDGLFLAIGHDPNSALFCDALKCDDRGYIILDDRTQRTSLEGVYAAGDVADHRYRQAGIAAGDGIKAALDAADFLRSIGFTSDIAEKWESRFFDPTEKKNSIAIPQITTKKEFDEQVRRSPVPVVLDFYAHYCPSCMRMLPVVEAVAGNLEGEVAFIKVDAEKAKELLELLSVPSVPTLLIYNKGALIARTQEIMTKKQLLSFIDTAIES